MSGDLGMQPREVHGKARAVLAFWFDEVSAEKHFVQDDALDRMIAERFGALRDEVLATGAAGWNDDPDSLLAAVILLDQFSRNLHRGTAEAFAADPLALRLTNQALVLGWDEKLPPDRRAFLYMPMMHAENPQVQEKCVTWFERMGDPDNLKYAIGHARIIERFGRFPARNAALGRESTPAELAFLAKADAT